MTTNNTQLDEILDALHHSHYDTIDGTDECKSSVSESKQAIFQWFAHDVIGENVSHLEFCGYQDNGGIPCDCGKLAINATKDEQRAILKKHGWIEGSK